MFTIQPVCTHWWGGGVCCWCACRDVIFFFSIVCGVLCAVPDFTSLPRYPVYNTAATITVTHIANDTHLHTHTHAVLWSRRIKVKWCRSDQPLNGTQRQRQTWSNSVSQVSVGISTFGVIFYFVIKRFLFPQLINQSSSGTEKEWTVDTVLKMYSSYESCFNHW